MKYVAFFRGLNVGGKNTVKMADLTRLFINMGFHDVKTYIQSGNVIFSSDRKQHILTPEIEHAFKEQFGFSGAVVIRSGMEMKAIVNALPFSKTEIEQAQNENPDVQHVYVYLSNDTFNVEKIYRLFAAYSGKDSYKILGREIYLLCFQSVRDSKLASALMKLPRPLTSRNLKTIEKIALMLC